MKDQDSPLFGTNELTNSCIPLGPFELTKLNAQIAVLLAENANSNNSNGASANQIRTGKEIADARKKTGTIGTARTLIAKHGFMGLYSGFHLHLSEPNVDRPFDVSPEY